MSERRPHNLIAYVNILHRDCKRFCDERLEPYGLSSGNYYYLLAVRQKPGCTPSELVQMLDVDKAYVTRTIQRLERLGFLRRETLQADNRSVQLWLTEQGEQAVHDLQPAFQAWSRGLSDAFTPEEYETLLNLMAKAVAFQQKPPQD